MSSARGCLCVRSNVTDVDQLVHVSSSALHVIMWMGKPCSLVRCRGGAAGNPYGIYAMKQGDVEVTHRKWTKWLSAHTVVNEVATINNNLVPVGLTLGSLDHTVVSGVTTLNKNSGLPRVSRKEARAEATRTGPLTFQGWERCVGVRQQLKALDTFLVEVDTFLQHPSSWRTAHWTGHKNSRNGSNTCWRPTLTTTASGSARGRQRSWYQQVSQWWGTKMTSWSTTMRAVLERRDSSVAID